MDRVAISVTASAPRGVQRAEHRSAVTAFAVLSGTAAVLAFELLAVLVLTNGHITYAVEASYTHLALAQQITHGHYGLVPGESAAPASSILFAFLLAALAPLGFGALLPIIINYAATLATMVFALLLANECRLPLQKVGPTRLFVLAIAVTLALNLAGLAFTGLEHSLHVACTVAYLLGLVRFVRRNRCDWWWFVCIIVQPLIRFEAAGMLVADALIFISFRRYGYAAAMILIGAALVCGYSLFLHMLGLPLLPTSVLARSDWSNEALGLHSGISHVIAAILRNLMANLNSFGATAILGGVAIALLWLGRSPTLLTFGKLDKAEQTRLMTVGFMAFVSFAQLAGGKIGWVPPRYEAYVLALNLCGLAIIYSDYVASWCERATWLRVSLVSLALLMTFGGYVTQTFIAPALARKEYLGPYQAHRFVTQFYRGPVAVDQIGSINYNNPFYVLDLSGLSSEPARAARANESSPEWMDQLLAEHNIKLAIIDTGEDPVVPVAWNEVAELRVASGSTANEKHLVLYARRPTDTPSIAAALNQFAPTLPAGVRLVYPHSRG